MTVSAAGGIMMQSYGAKGAGQSAESSLAAPTAKDKFLDYMKMTPAERMAAAILEEMGISKEDLEAMPPEQRKAIEDTIRERIKEKMKAEGMEKGRLADVTV
ncbi:MAG TPA: hypothetical protein VFS04_03750 [Alphaproteobacteria bacterium]|nr:hypothetical protein [Alphaproteobacteria bacterium]